MTVRLYANGTGGTLGDELITETELYTTGIVYFVHHSGSDSNTGQTRQKPYASFVFALTQAISNDIIVLMDGHTETISSPQTVSQDGLKIVGEGSTSGVPTAKLTSALTNQVMLTISGINVAIANIYFPSGATTNATNGRVKVTGARHMMRGCYIECGAGDATSSVAWSDTATGARCFDTSFVNVSTTIQPVCGLIMSGSTDNEFEAVTLDGGTVGFAIAGILDSSVFSGTAPERLRCQQMRLLNGAGFLSGAGTTGYIGISERTGGPLVTGFNSRLPNGFRQVGDALLADGEIYLSTAPIYVHYGTGDDANGGFDELNPKKTLESAVSVISDDCTIIVLLPGHDEPLAAGIQNNVSGTTIVGCGTSGGKPSCRIYQNASGPFIVMRMSEVTYLRNIWFDGTTLGATQTEMVTMSVPYAEMRGCLVSAGYRDHIGVDINSNLVTVRDTKVESTGTGVTTRASRGILIDSEGNVSDIDIRGCELSNGEGGFTDVALHSQDAVPRLYMISVTLSFGADVTINSLATGIVNPETATGSSLVTW